MRTSPLIQTKKGENNFENKKTISLDVKKVRYVSACDIFNGRVYNIKFMDQNKKVLGFYNPREN